MDSVYKEWNERIDELANDDFKEGVLKAIRKLKDEIYHLKVDNYNQSMGRIIRDDKRLVLSAPEIIIGDVNLGGMLNPGGESRVIIRGGDVSLQGSGDVGKIDLRAPVIEQIAENPGIDGNEHVVGDVSRIVSQAANITIQSDMVSKNGALPPVGNMSEVGIRIKSDHQVDISATASHDNLLAQIEQQIERLKTSKEHLDEEVKNVKKEFKAQQEEIDDLLEKKSKLAKADNAVRTDYHDMEELNIRIEELSMSLTETVYRYSNMLSMMAESARLLNYFKSRKEEVQKENAADFKTDSTLASVNIASETVNVSSMDGDHHVRTNETAGVNILTHAMSVFGDIDEKGALLDGNRLFVNMKTVDIATSGSADMETDDQDVLTKAQYEAQGDVFIRSKNITLESVDYEVADKKRREKGLTADGRILLRSKTIEASTVNSKDVEVDEKGLITKATYTSEGDVIVRSKTFSVASVDTQQDGDKVQETALTKDGSFTVRTEKSEFSSTDTEGKATGSVSVNAKDITVKSVDVEKEKRTDSALAQGGKMVLVSEKIFAGALSKNIKSKKIQAQSEEVGLFADKTLEAQQAEGKAMLQLADGKAAVGGSETQLYGPTTINAKTEVKDELKAPKATIDHLEAKTSLKSPNISDGIAVAVPASPSSLTAKLKAEE